MKDVKIWRGMISMKVNKTLLLCMLLIFTLLVTACTSKEESNALEEGTGETGAEETDVTKHEPVTIKFYIPEAYLNDEEVKVALEEPLKEKYPYITLEIVRPVEDNTLEHMIAAKKIPDLFIGWNGDLEIFRDLDLLTSLDAQIEQAKFDLSRFETSAIDTMRNEGKDGLLYGIPYAMNFNLMYYNKDVFDLFGAPYPTDGMYWDEVIDLSKKVSGTMNGMQYQGILTDFDVMSFQLSLPYIDPKTMEPAVTSEIWKKVFETGKAAYDASPPVEGASFGTQNVAMWAYKNRNSSLKDPSEAGVNWDVVQFPSFHEKPGVGSQVDVHVVFMSSTSEHKEDAFHVIEILTSDETQTELAKIGKLPALKDKSIINHFGASIPYLADKNWKGVFQAQFDVAPERVLPDHLFRNFMFEAFDRYASGKQDVNTALRTASDELKKVLKDNLQKE